MTPTIKWAIALLMGATIFRVQAGLFLSDLQMFGGPAPDGWFGPWLSDTIIGFLLPVMLFLFWTRRSVAVWGTLIAYNAVGAFDYSQGLITQAQCCPAETRKSRGALCPTSTREEDKRKTKVYI